MKTASRQEPDHAALGYVGVCARKVRVCLAQAHYSTCSLVSVARGIARYVTRFRERLHQPGPLGTLMGTFLRVFFINFLDSHFVLTEGVPCGGVASGGLAR